MENKSFYLYLFMSIFSLIFIYNIYLIKYRKEVKKSFYCYHFTTSYGLKGISATKTIKGINYGYIYATTNKNRKNLGYSFFECCSSCCVIIDYRDRDYFIKNINKNIFLSFLFPHDIFKCFTQEMITKEKCDLKFSNVIYLSPTCILLRNVTEVVKSQKNKIKKTIRRVITSIPNYMISIANLNSIISVPLLLLNTENSNLAAISISTFCILLIIFISIPLVIYFTHHCITVLARKLKKILK